MKLTSYFLPESQHKSFGLVDGDGVIDLGLRIGWRFPDIKAALEAQALPALAAFANQPADYHLSDLTFLPVIEQPHKIFCVGMNYAAKRQEFEEKIDAPTLFIRFADSLTGQGCPVVRPTLSDQFDYEGELAVVIGKPARAVGKESALSYVAGYSCFMDGTARDMQFAWFTAGKNWSHTGAFGPWLITADEIPEPNRLAIHTYLNGQMVQDDNTANMVRSVPELIAYISAFSSLSPGDVIITGSPGGVGMKRTPPLFLKAGDLIEVEIESVGRLISPVASEEKFGR
ncbi:2-keto-4-pentenoate hydratase/2-oxohepta-3-ene-1,7-dioic acid hydratase (catechol pathway) [Formivibrio citricus]|uniref:2-keto-4-pentenoate hydratase/2-oxohepta-3-ene-1,7-dioic acid hydratase (Catechol pathway) n=1 Tax=Formivibrio citricus TaxID=83765 RepID=A0A1I5CWT8_9NEIS|nr:fumarylacetoacetate hydrolase family protein [Formivibrio citricus]SFN91470.1 2-keto-4-pentenoate hydratase/2-oxohepta-3-ene-1,7-dioic acid hydratase (catechol pathway) [Formivibrio citricus]